MGKHEILRRCLDLVTLSHFCNKLWQAVRMFLMYKEQILPNERVSECAAPSQLLALDLALEDNWILHQCAETVKQANQDLESYNFHLAVRTMKNFVKGMIIITLN